MAVAPAKDGITKNRSLPQMAQGRETAGEENE